MRFTRTTQVAALAAAGMLALSACSESSTSNNSASGSAAPTNIDCASGTLSAEGSSAQNNAMTEWIKRYQTACPDATVNYNPTGSGAGVQQFIAGQVGFAGSDSALKADEGEVEGAKQRCGGNEAWNLPMVVGPISVAYNVEGVDQLVLDAATTAQIFSGSIKVERPGDRRPERGVTLPDAAITVFYRSDEVRRRRTSPSTWRRRRPRTGRRNRPRSGPVPAKKEKSTGVQQATLQQANSITCVGGLRQGRGAGIAAVDNGSGPVTLDATTAGKALEEARSSDGEQPGTRPELGVHHHGQGVYPIVLVTYEIACSKGLDSTQSALVKSFLTYTASGGGSRSSRVSDTGRCPVPWTRRCRPRSLLCSDRPQWRVPHPSGPSPLNVGS